MSRLDKLDKVAIMGVIVRWYGLVCAVVQSGWREPADHSVHCPFIPLCEGMLSNRDESSMEGRWVKT